LANCMCPLTGKAAAKFTAIAIIIPVSTIRFMTFIFIDFLRKTKRRAKV
jgi:hypothetical protein